MIYVYMINQIDTSLLWCDGIYGEIMSNKGDWHDVMMIWWESIGGDGIKLQV